MAKIEEGSPLKEHIRRVHVGTKIHDCEKCSKEFSTYHELNNHLRAVHYDVKPFICELCNKRLSSKSALYKHKQNIRIHKVQDG